MVGFPGVLIFLLFDFILIRSVHFFATYKMLEPETFDLSPMKIAHLIIGGISIWLWHSDYRESWGRFSKTL